MIELFIGTESTIKGALKKIDETARKILIVVGGGNRLLGTLTDGDIRRLILKGAGLDEPIAKVYNPNPIYLIEPWDLNAVRELMISKKIEAVPVVNKEMEMVEILFWSDVFKNQPLGPTKEKIGIPLVIMAGGRGTRLDPFTRILPKPLIPIGEKPIIEIIIEKFAAFGVDTVYITVNYKGEMIKSYFDYQENLPVSLHYIFEKEYLGTAGSLRFLPEGMPKTFILSNCDVIVNTDYHDLLTHHRKNRHALTIVGSIQHYKIPYGIISFNSGGVVDAIIEKPEYDFTVNTGLYVLETEVLKLIPEGKTFHITDLIGRILKEKEKVGVYPVSERSYIDLGQWEEYKKAIRILSE
jgi:dTDP-glucose pyrophosphorylase